MQKISIIMPSFNQAGYINEARNSVLNQDYEDKELIVIDGGSDDGTVDILESYGDRIKYWVSESDGGQSDALNKALRQVTGDIVGWMNADDYYLPGAFKAVIDAANGSPEKTCFHGSSVMVGSAGQYQGLQISFPFSQNQFLAEGFHVFTQAFFWRSECVRGKFEFNEQLHRTMDFHFFAWLGKAYGNQRFCCINRALGAFRRHEAQKTTASGGDLVDVEYQQIETLLDVKTSRLHKRRALRMLYRARRAAYYALLFFRIKKTVPRDLYRV
jgi:glycosyltransferase involved in cell wall biosynthesis